METEDTIYAIAVKSGTNVFNSSSKKKQEQNFNAAKKLADRRILLVLPKKLVHGELL